jgi:hypothetical protein
MRKKKGNTHVDVKGIVSKTLSQILTNKSLKSASSLATEYILHKKKGTSINSFAATSTSIAQLALVCKEAAGKRKSAAYELFYKLWYETFEEMVTRLSKEILSALRANYDTTIIQKIIDALIDFEGPILAQGSLEKILQCSADPKKVQKARLGLKASETLLKGSALTVPEQQTIERINRKYKDILDNVREVSMDTMKLTALYRIKNAIPEAESISIAEYVSNFPKIEKEAIERQQWHRAWHTELCKIIFNQGQGRPSQIFFNAIQIIIYRLLADESKPKTVQRHKAWCVRLTTSIIREAYTHLSVPMLTPKKVEKLVHGG